MAAMMMALSGEAAASATGAATPAAGATITVPSGAEVRFIDSVTDVPGPAGLTYRYRFVMPDLAARVPTTEGAASEDLTPEDMAELDRLGTDAGMDMAPPDDATTTGAEAELVSPEDLDLPDFRPEDFADAGAEEAADKAAAGIAPAPLPADPDILLQDPVHGDMVWLCDHWVLPRLAAPAPLPGQVIISLSDRPTAFGEINADAVQLFEAFSIPPDRQHCVWEAW